MCDESKCKECNECECDCVCLKCDDCGRYSDVYEYIEQWKKNNPNTKYLDWCNLWICCCDVDKHCLDKKDCDKKY